VTLSARTPDDGGGALPPCFVEPGKVSSAMRRPSFVLRQTLTRSARAADEGGGARHADAAEAEEHQPPVTRSGTAVKLIAPISDAFLAPRLFWHSLESPACRQLSSAGIWAGDPLSTDRRNATWPHRRASSRCYMRT
jgi:hypothetical protein